MPSRPGRAPAGARRARRARVALAFWPHCRRSPRTRRCTSAADALVANTDRILAANAEDLRCARAADTPAAMLDRLALDPKRVEGIAAGLRQVAGLPDPVGEVLRGYTLPNGLALRQQRVPLGVVGIVYEGRPNVTVDAFGLTLKSGNAVLLRGSSSAAQLQRGAGRGVARRTARRGPARRRRATAPGADRSGGHAPDPGPRPGRRGDPARGRRPDRRGGPRRAGADHRDRRRQLPRLRARCRRSRHGRANPAELQDPSTQRLQRRRDAAGRRGDRRPGDAAADQRAAGRRRDRAPGSRTTTTCAANTCRWTSRSRSSTASTPRSPTSTNTAPGTPRPS